MPPPRAAFGLLREYKVGHVHTLPARTPGVGGSICAVVGEVLVVSERQVATLFVLAEVDLRTAGLRDVLDRTCR